MAVSPYGFVVLYVKLTSRAFGRFQRQCSRAQGPLFPVPFGLKDFREVSGYLASYRTFCFVTWCSRENLPDLPSPIGNRLFLPGSQLPGSGLFVPKKSVELSIGRFSRSQVGPPSGFITSGPWQSLQVAWIPQKSASTPVPVSIKSPLILTHPDESWIRSNPMFPVTCGVSLWPPNPQSANGP